MVNNVDTSIVAYVPLASVPYTAYSLRKVISSYSGPAIRVRRSSDNAEQDISFDSLNELMAHGN